MQKARGTGLFAFLMRGGDSEFSTILVFNITTKCEKNVFKIFKKNKLPKNELNFLVQAKRYVLYRFPLVVNILLSEISCRTERYFGGKVEKYLVTCYSC